jgi:hypothetical protein
LSQLFGEKGCAIKRNAHCFYGVVMLLRLIGSRVVAHAVRATCAGDPALLSTAINRRLCRRLAYAARRFAASHILPDG